jgi:hypothetical protein
MQGADMSDITLPVRFYGSEHATLTLDLQSTAVMVVDANGTQSHPIVTDAIAPVLQSARAIGMRVFYFHEDGYGTGGPADITRELHGIRHGHPLDSLFFESPQWTGALPAYHSAIAPAPDEADFPKSSKDGFQTTNADYYLRSWGITTLLAVGFAFDRFAREIGGILKVSSSALTAAECQTVGRARCSQRPYDNNGILTA